MDTASSGATSPGGGDHAAVRWTPEKAQLFSSAYTLTLARDSMDLTLIAVAEWWRDRARRAFLRSFYALEVPRDGR